ncbi:MAG: D-alanyl-D-alanine carboxypeptidase/D-alanyl-D-alanine-endopeptidase [Sulfobacillus acidophilus]|uniref:D-alanyl-D-alanine carboxypeptidase/D-alanyl-D-alanine-endopeptidase n=1 Tax=Sulfobacillus acidophilus TaxID=53633 RepID=A0A2T2WP06_9FIRM|nr:MAG: D-alanyl-D-alanine carboxypeptidase/D-alanyl-D-alanine-endopeptidase [Sulfobacillus acidophilus]
MGHKALRAWAVVACSLVVLTMPHSTTAKTVRFASSARFAGQAAPLVHQSQPIPRTPTNPLQKTWGALAQGPELVHSRVSAYAYDLTTHTVLAALHPSLLLTPGSVTKLFTSAAALAELGPQFTYKTTVMVPSVSASGKPGPIYLVGGGNPWLEANGRHDLEELAQAVAASIPKATQVIGVNSLFTPPTYGIGWPVGGIPQNYSAGTSALVAERSEVSVLVKGADRAGLRPKVFLSFNGTARDPDYFTIVNRAITTIVGMRPSIAVTRLIGTNRLVITGHIAENRLSSATLLSVGDPPLFAASLFQSALMQQGVSFQRQASIATKLPTGLITIASNLSPNLATELILQNQYSINQMAENLYRELSVATTGLGTLSGARTAMASFTAQAGVTGYREQVDGSGLSPLDQMSARQVVQLLTYAASKPWFPTFKDSLIHINSATGCGFLCPPSWHLSLPAHTSIWVKPGNLANQWNLAGYVLSANHNLIAFAILDDGTPTVENMQPHSDVTRMMESIAQWPYLTAPFGRSATTAPTGDAPQVVQSLLSHIPNYDTGSSLSIAMVNVANHQTIFQENGQTLVPSGLSPRLLLAIAALQTRNTTPALPPCQVLTTTKITFPTLARPLILDGNGNNLTDEQMQQLADAIRSHGITRIAGPIEYVNPDAGFQQSRWPGGLAWEALGQGWASPSSPIYVNSNQIPLDISALTPGSPAQLSLGFHPAPVRIVNNTTVAARGTAPQLTIRLQFHSHTFIMSGSLPLGYHATKSLAPPDPGLLAALKLQHDLTQLGIMVAKTPIAISHVPTGAQVVAQLPGQSVAAIAQQSLKTPSLVPSNQLIQSLGPTIQKNMEALMNHSPMSVTDWTGGAIGNYLTALGVAQALTNAYHHSGEQPVVRLLSAQVWESTSPEQYEAAGYVDGPGQTLDAIVVLASSLKWTGQLAPQILSPSSK